MSLWGWYIYRDTRCGKEVKLYGIVDGFENGKTIAKFVADQLVSEILPPDKEKRHIMNSSPSDAEVFVLNRIILSQYWKIFFQWL